MSEAKAKIIENKIIKMEIKQQLDNCKIAVSDNVDEMTQSNCCIKPKKIELRQSFCRVLERKGLHIIFEIEA